MKTLYIYPTARGIRNRYKELQEHNALLPTFMRIDEFEKRAIILPELKMVDSLQRVLLLQRATRFDAFKKLRISRELVKFFTRSDSILKFFEELIYEGVNFSDLIEGDSYAEFGEHIEVLEELLEGYRIILEDRGLTDRVFIPKNYHINLGFVNGFDRFELYLEGYMSRFELKIVEEIAKHKPFIIHFQTSRFNRKIQDRFLDLGIEGFEEDSFVSFDLKTKKIISSEKNHLEIRANIFSVEERLGQIPIIFQSVQNMVDNGISPEDIVVVVPDERFKEFLRLYDRYNNFNFAMGFDYEKTRGYKRFEAIYQYWQSFSEESIFLLKKYGVDLERLKELTSSEVVTAKEFFNYMDRFDLDLKTKVVEENIYRFQRTFREEKMSLKKWLFLWLKRLSKLSIDDVRGGKITVMGALETRGVAFKGVIIIDFNDGIVPAIPAKDEFLNSSVRKLANLPTKNDREALQKQLYKRLIENGDEVVITYSTSGNKSPASYLYELNLGVGKRVEPNLKLLYHQPNGISNHDDPVVENFNAGGITWSATRLKTFLTCKRKYYYLYQRKLEPKETDEINEGRILHKVLERLFKERAYYHTYGIMEEHLHRLIDAHLETTSVKVAYSKLLWRAKLTKFIENQIEHFKMGWKVVEREREIVGEIEGIKFKGVVDRIDRRDNETLILDYKSGSVKEANRVKNLEKLTDFQMSIYSEILKKEYDKMGLGFIELFGKGEIVMISLLNTKTELLKKIIGDLHETKEFEATRCEDISHCEYCEFTLLCERGIYL